MDGIPLAILAMGLFAVPEIIDLLAEKKSYQPGDVWATVSQALGIPSKTVHRSKRGRPMKLANGGTPIKELIG